jgi:hypothetical protein
LESNIPHTKGLEQNEGVGVVVGVVVVVGVGLGVGGIQDPEIVKPSHITNGSSASIQAKLPKVRL